MWSNIIIGDAISDEILMFMCLETMKITRHFSCAKNVKETHRDPTLGV